MKKAYITKSFNAEHEGIIATANDIITAYESDGFYSLTLRQLYYQFVSRDLLPNTLQSYKRLGGIINNARLAGRIDWLSITDGTRNVRGNSHWDTPNEVISSAAASYHRDLWANQPRYVEVWIEKDALINVISPTCLEMDVRFFSCRGYTSQSEMWSASQRIKGHLMDGQVPIIIHLGDHDPSGIDMTRDVTDRLAMFMGGIQVERIALNMEQIDEFSPPPNYAKTTDARYARYVEKFATEDSWELDALNPTTLADLVRTEVEKHRDLGLWEEAVAEQEGEKNLLKAAAKRWDELVEVLS